MSQEKVDRYKEEKKNRKKAVRKGKILSALLKFCMIIVVCGLAFWAGWSVYRRYESSRPVETAEVDYTAMDNLQTKLDEIAAAADTSSDATADGEGGDEAEGEGTDTENAEGDTEEVAP
ncbi:MAG: hypothetical protein LBQ95_03245 [Lachnospiraceae bacterium]|jgi:cytoskeletal protein RodZ|nr:hypothetical protein [Lachnospiraceae bacterium]